MAAAWGCATSGGGGGASKKLPNGLNRASAGLRELFADGSVKGKSVIEVRATLTENGFSQTISQNGKGYLFTNGTGEAVRLMSKGGSWEIRIMNADGNYLDEFGNVAQDRSGSHGILLFSK
ncbi:MAG: hypothetical protein WBW04_18035 [Nitrolancea sp.]